MQIELDKRPNQNYEVDVYHRNNIIVTMQVTAKDEKEAITLAGQSLKVKVKKSYG